MADPANVLAIDDIRSMAKARVRTVVATRDAIEAAIDKHHRLDNDVEGVTSLALDDSSEHDDLAKITEVTEDAPIVKLANLLIRQAIQDRASDIHIEPTEREVRVRYRIDGVLHEVMRSPKRVQAGLISRLKIMADLNIAERRIPQDGRVSAVIGGRQVDLRVATLPTVYGEKVVMRILDKGTALLDLADLGFLPDTMARYETVFHKPYGTILVTGPTGSGKSTTLYATLNQLNDPAKNIITVEDPVEYRLAGVNQVQVNVKAGMTFAAALRSILRSDPTSCSSARSATGRRPRSPWRRRSPATSCSRRCTRTTRRPRPRASSRWASSRTSSPARSTASWRSASSVGCASGASSRTS
jgi:type IV pilus assembly protein PilB